MLTVSGRVLNYLWKGWGSFAALMLLVACWQLLSETQTELILPAPLAVFERLSELLLHGPALEELAITARRAGLGFILAVFPGLILGVVAGYSVSGSILARPVISVLLGTPPIAWLVLALIWFGTGDGTPVFTVLLASLPVIFLQSMQGMRTLDGHHRELATAFHLPLWMRWTDVYLPHILSYVIPAVITALGISWKVVVMAELLATDRGIGAALSVARTWLDTTAALAYIVAAVGLLLVIEFAFLEPLKHHIERWRDR